MTPTKVSVGVSDKLSDGGPDELIEAAFAKLDPMSLGIAVGGVGGAGLFLATVFLLLKGGAQVGQNLSLLGQYFAGFAPTWVGAFVGLLEAGTFGFVVGFVTARLRNWALTAYAALLKRQVEGRSRRDLLDKIR